MSDVGAVELPSDPRGSRGDGRALSWQEYASLPEDPRVEYVDGRLAVSPSPTRSHQRICTRLERQIEETLPENYDVIVQWSWHPRPGGDEFIPDVMVVPATEDDLRFTGMPVLVVEVLSSNRADDLVRKATKYAVLGLPHYWVVDPLEPSVTAFVLVDGAYVLEQRLTGDEEGTLSLGVGVVSLAPSALTAHHARRP